MTGGDSPALRIALAYYRAWTSRDIDLAMTYIDPAIVRRAGRSP